MKNCNEGILTDCYDEDFQANLASRYWVEARREAV
jgi:hypothetical protein